MLRLIIMIMCFCVAACDVFDDSTSVPIEVDEKKLAQYWLAKNQSLAFASSNFVANKQAGRVRIRYLIDETGNVQDPQILSSTPEGMWDSSALSALRQLSYEPAKGNHNHQAVYTSIEFNFTAE